MRITIEDTAAAEGEARAATAEVACDGDAAQVRVLCLQAMLGLGLPPAEVIREMDHAQKELARLRHFLFDHFGTDLMRGSQAEVTLVDFTLLLLRELQQRREEREALVAAVERLTQEVNQLKVQGPERLG